MRSSSHAGGDTVEHPGGCLFMEAALHSGGGGDQKEGSREDIGSGGRGKNQKGVGEEEIRRVNRWSSLWK